MFFLIKHVFSPYSLRILCFLWMIYAISIVFDLIVIFMILITEWLHNGLLILFSH